MVEDDHCLNIFQQSTAVQGALKRADEELLTDYLTLTLSKSLSSKENDKLLKEILDIFKREEDKATQKRPE